ncbi:MAG: hypothetical protein CMK46_06575 [Porticoccus sp.]|nr:hypothetical protein [Porticoccus sp.]
MKKLPNSPRPSQYKSLSEYEEALGAWNNRVGRIKGMAARATAASKDSPDTSQDLGQPPTRK